MANEIRIKVLTEDGTQQGRDTIRGGFGVTGQQAGKDFGTNLKSEMDKGTATAADSAATKVSGARSKIKSAGKDAGDDWGKSFSGSLLPAADKAGSDAGKKATDSAKKEAQQGAPGIGMLIAAGIATAAPIAGAALVGGLGTAFVAVTALANRNNAQVRQSFTDVKTSAVTDLQSIASSGAVPLSSALEKIGATLNGVTPQLQSAFTAAQPGITAFGDGIDRLVTNLIPGLTEGIRNSGPVMQGTANLMGSIGTMTGNLFSTLSQHSAQFGQVMTSLGPLIQNIGSILGNVIGNASSGFSTTISLLNGVTKAISSISAPLSSVAGYLPTVMIGFQAFKALDPALSSVSTKIGTFAKGLEATSTVTTMAKSGLTNIANVLGNSGVLGFALAGATAAFMALGQAEQDEQQIANQRTQSASSIAQALEASNGAITEQTRATTASMLQGQDWAKTLMSNGASLKDLTDAALGVPGALDKVRAELNNGGQAIFQNSAALGMLIPLYGDATKMAQQYQGATSGAGQATGLTTSQFNAASGAAYALGMSTNSAAAAFRTAIDAGGAAAQSTQAASASFLQAQNSIGQAASAITTSITQQSQAVVQAQQAYDNASYSYNQSSLAVVQANHGVEQANQSLKQSQYGVEQAEISYNNALDQEKASQQAVADARKAAQQQLIDLALQQKNAAASAENANVSLYDAIQAAAKLGVNKDNAAAIAATPEEDINAGNVERVKAAIALIQAENQVADAQNTSNKAQDSLTLARQKGIEGDSGVIAAEKNLVSSTQQVENAQHALAQAQDGVRQAEYGVEQAHQAVTNALHSEEQAAQATRTAQQQLTTAQQNASTTLDVSTAAGQRNMGMVLQLSNALRSSGLPQQDQYNQLIRDVAPLFGGATDQAAAYLRQLGLISGQNFMFNITGVAGVDTNWDAVKGTVMHSGLGGLFGKAAGGPSVGLTWVGEQGPELVSLPAGSSVMTNANSMQHVRSGEVNAPGRAAGGPASSLASLVEGALVIGGMTQARHSAAVALGIPGVNGLPPYVPPAPSSGGFSAPVGGYGSGVGQWAPEVLQALAALGQPSSLLPHVLRRMNQESGGNPNSINNWDINAQRGDPSRGLMQTIMSTFLAYRNPAWSANIYDPLNNIYTGLNYAEHRYPSIQYAMDKPGGYAAGGSASGLATINEMGQEMVRLPNGSTVYPHANAMQEFRNTPPFATPTSQSAQVEFLGDTTSAFATAFMRLVREGKVIIRQSQVVP